MGKATGTMARNGEATNNFIHRVQQPTTLRSYDETPKVKKMRKVKSKHPTIGEFYSQRARKKKLCQRRLPSKPRAICIYFVLMGKAWSYKINMCIEHKLQQILPKLTKLLASNKEIIEIIKQKLSHNDIYF